MWSVLCASLLNVALQPGLKRLQQALVFVPARAVFEADVTAEAWRFFYYCWPGENNGKRDDFLREFILQLKSGQYWPLIWKLNEHSLGTQYLVPEMVKLVTQ